MVDKVVWQRRCYYCNLFCQIGDGGSHYSDKLHCRERCPTLSATLSQIDGGIPLIVFNSQKSKHVRQIELRKIDFQQRTRVMLTCTTMRLPFPIRLFHQGKILGRNGFMEYFEKQAR
ncbi:hypothetical protein LOAG_04030 [Loa loa]|uniref:Uncharacterized protein n=1 Tax=Loa loa TaxID=7209 RepID=A0A1S0U4Y4_LOALO|nr:hypothetical protein LOAG_04030 [Loa loa]EFO24454.1 hypothetical protein LOAG_04030 [Loa loa]